MVAEFYLATHKMQAQRVNQMWCIDFVADNLFDGCKLRMHGPNCWKNSAATRSFTPL